MFGYVLISTVISSSQKIEKPFKVIGYNFKNTGTTIALISRLNGGTNERPIPLFPGEAMDTRVNGGLDQTEYRVDFKSINDQDSNSQQSELYLISFKAI
jgi:hypothetical protein